MLASTLFVLIALLNLLPGIVAFRAERTNSLYGFTTDRPAMELAMRHRAVLLALVGLLLGLAAYDEAWRKPALLVAGVSTGFVSAALRADRSTRRADAPRRNRRCGRAAGAGRSCHRPALTSAA